MASLRWSLTTLAFIKHHRVSHPYCYWTRHCIWGRRRERENKMNGERDGEGRERENKMNGERDGEGEKERGRGKGKRSRQRLNRERTR